MADYQLQSSRFHKETSFTARGVIAPADGHKLYGEQSIKIQVENVDGDNEIVLQGRLANSTTWQNIGSVKGQAGLNTHDETVFDISHYDYIRFEAFKYSNVAGKIPKLIASSFFSKNSMNSGVESALAYTNDLLFQVLCEMKEIKSNQNKMEIYLQEITNFKVGE